MLHRTQWSLLLLIWKARFSPHPPTIMSKGALTIPGFTFTNFVARSSGQIECVLYVWACIYFMYVCGIAWFESSLIGNVFFFSLWEVGGG